MMLKPSILTAVIIVSGTCVNLYLHVNLSRKSSFDEKRLPLDRPSIYQDPTNAGGGLKLGMDWNQIGNSIPGSTSFSCSKKSVSISSDGTVVAVGENDHTNAITTGIVRIYARDGSYWSQLGNDLQGDIGDELFGGSISLSSDGRTIAIDGKDSGEAGCTLGYVRVYSFNGSSWNKGGADIKMVMFMITLGTQYPFLQMATWLSWELFVIILGFIASGCTTGMELYGCNAGQI